MCSTNGILAYICTNKFFVTEYGSKLRSFLRKNDLLRILDFEQCEVFENVLVSSAITIVRKVNPLKRKTIGFRRYCKLKHAEFIDAFLQNSHSLDDYPLEVLTDKEWSFSSKRMLALKAKIEGSNQRIGNISSLHVYRGVTTGFNHAFIIDNVKREEMIYRDEKCACIIKNLLQGENIRKWRYNPSNEFLLQTGYDINIKEKFPFVFLHLRQWEKELQKRADQGANWWNLRACKYYMDFERPEKIIWGLTADKWAFAYDDKQHYLPSNGYILTSDEMPIKYLLGLLNSTLLHFYFGFIGIMTAGGAYTLKAATIEALPIPLASKEEQSPIIELVDQILAAKKTNSLADTSTLENKIDQLVYQLYGLSEEEIALVETQKTNKKKA